tara:strand:+ start:285 stop:434 length:150 start_codon:yes stop_codon:yes gene_type:complete
MLKDKKELHKIEAELKRMRIKNSWDKWSYADKKTYMDLINKKNMELKNE